MVYASIHLEPSGTAKADRTTSAVHVEIGTVTVFLKNAAQCRQIAKEFERAASLYGPMEVYAAESPEVPPMSDDDVPF